MVVNYSLTVFKNGVHLQYDEFEKLIYSIELKSETDELYELLLEAYGDVDAEWRLCLDDMIMVSGLLPNLTFKLTWDDNVYLYTQRQMFKDGQLIDDKSSDSSEDVVKVLKRRWPSIYYKCKLSTQKPRSQLERYQVKRFVRGVSILRNVFHQHAALKIQRAWDRHWYEPNESGESRAALKTYNHFSNNEPIPAIPSNVQDIRVAIDYNKVPQKVKINGIEHVIKMPPLFMKLRLIPKTNFYPKIPPIR